MCDTRKNFIWVYKISKHTVKATDRWWSKYIEKSYLPDQFSCNLYNIFIIWNKIFEKEIWYIR